MQCIIVNYGRLLRGYAIRVQKGTVKNSVFQLKICL